MRLFATSDIHLNYQENRDAIERIPPHQDDWLILAGDVGDTFDQIEWAFDCLGKKFKQLVWVPGNHELWTTSRDVSQLKGLNRYLSLVDLAQSYGVLTPEDPYQIADFGQGNVRIAPLFLLYDYSFRPSDVTQEGAIDWAKQSGILCADEHLLHTAPYDSITAWCHERCDITARRLADERNDVPTILINHFPLRQSHAVLPRIPRFSIWCGTTRTEQWHVTYNAQTVISGHLHIRMGRVEDNVRFEEVSWGYPKQWQGRRSMDCVLQCIEGAS